MLKPPQPVTNKVFLGADIAATNAKIPTATATKNWFQKAVESIAAITTPVANAVTAIESAKAQIAGSSKWTEEAQKAAAATVAAQEQAKTTRLVFIMAGVGVGWLALRKFLKKR